ncbi:hypothetical protein ASF88_12170 [Leifsonia sp. Leaf336]|nr:hypothetical protein ASF88_12170 [Leifsonia sp. Leaf336]
MHPTCARSAIRKVDMSSLSMRESLIYSAAYSEAIADHAALFEQVITAYAAALAQAEADAARYYHQAYCDCVQRTSRQIVHAVDVGERREQWRSKYGLNGAVA